MLESILEGMASYYSKNLARVVQKGQIQSALKCRHWGGHTPLGYYVNKETKLYEVNEEEAETIRLIYSKYLEGYGCQQLLGFLNGNGYKTKQGKLFTKSSLNYILTSPKYKGTYIFNRFKDKKASGKRSPTPKDESEIVTIENGMPAIVDSDTFDKVQLKLENEKGKHGKYRANRKYLLSGLIQCTCGYAYIGNYRKNGRGKKDYTSYRCSGRVQKMNCCNTEIRQEYVEGYVIDQLRENLFNKESVNQLSSLLEYYNKESKQSLDTEIALQDERLININSRIGDIINLVTNSGISINTVSSQIRELEVSKNEVEDSIERLLFEKTKIKVREREIEEIALLTKQLISGEKQVEIEDLIKAYVDKVLVHQDTIEIYFKISVIEDEKFVPLVVEEYKSVILEKYKIINR